MTQIPPALIGTAGPILDTHYTHAELNALFMQAGFPGDPPEGNKTHKCLSWMRRANVECPDPLKLFGVLIAELMDGEPTAWRSEQYQKEGDARERIRTVMGKALLSYQRGGYIIGAHLKGPSKSLSELVKAEGLSAVEVEYQRAYRPASQYFRWLPRRPDLWSRFPSGCAAALACHPTRRRRSRALPAPRWRYRPPAADASCE